MYYFGDTCNVICDTGYELIGDEVWTCQSNGSWSGSDDDVCRRGMCVCMAVAYIHDVDQFSASHLLIPIICVLTENSWIVSAREQTKIIINYVDPFISYSTVVLYIGNMEVRDFLP